MIIPQIRSACVWLSVLAATLCYSAWADYLTVQRHFLIHNQPSGQSDQLAVVEQDTLLDLAEETQTDNYYHVKLAGVDGGGWTDAKLKDLVTQKCHVRISGWLMWDQEHPEQIGNHRATLWEIHPIHLIEFEQNGQRVALENN